MINGRKGYIPKTDEWPSGGMDGYKYNYKDTRGKREMDVTADE